MEDDSSDDSDSEYVPVFSENIADDDEDESVSFILQQLLQFKGCELHEMEGTDDGYIGMSTLANDWLENVDFNLNTESFQEVVDNAVSSRNNLDAETIKNLYSGGSNPRSLLIDLDHVEDMNEFDINFDVDSVLGCLSNIAAFKQGFLYSPFPNASRNIKNNIHMSVRVKIGDSFKSVPIHEVPHFFLGNCAAFTDLSLYVFCPAMFDHPNRTTNYMTENSLQRFFDNAWFPALKKVLPSHILQHINSLSWLQAKQNALSQSSGSTDARTRTLQLKYFMDARFLEDIWFNVEQNLRQAGMQDFKNAFLFVNGKNFKLRSKSTSPGAAIVSFLKLWQFSINEEFIDNHQVFFDIGKEITPKDKVEHYTLLWRTCCLKKNARQP